MTDARRLCAFSSKSRFVNDEHSVLPGKVLHHVLLQMIANFTGIPFCTPEEVLNVLGRRITSVFGQLPAILTRHIREQHLQIDTCPPTKLLPANAVAQSTPFVPPFPDIIDARLPCDARSPKERFIE